MSFIFQGSYCDSKEYAGKIDLVEGNSFFTFISNIVKTGINSSTYSKRADLIISRMKVTLQELQYGMIMVKCDTTAGHVLETMFNDCPTATEQRSCSNKKCPGTLYKSTSDINFISYQVNNSEMIKELQSFLDERVNTENARCIDNNCTSSISIQLSKMHLFIDVLFWESKNL